MYLSKLQNVFVQILKCICLNCNMYFSKLHNLSYNVQIVKCSCWNIFTFQALGRPSVSKWLEERTFWPGLFQRFSYLWHICLAFNICFVFVLYSPIFVTYVLPLIFGDLFATTQDWPRVRNGQSQFWEGVKRAAAEKGTRNLWRGCGILQSLAINQEKWIKSSEYFMGQNLVENILPCLYFWLTYTINNLRI